MVNGIRSTDILRGCNCIDNEDRDLLIETIQSRIDTIRFVSRGFNAEDQILLNEKINRLTGLGNRVNTLPEC